MYAQLEEDHGLARRSMAILERATQVVADEDKFEMFTVYIAKATANFGLPATRPIYEKAIEGKISRSFSSFPLNVHYFLVLPDKQTAEICLRFAALERKLGEIDRARAIYAHASQFCDPRVNPRFWTEWNNFEIETGSEDTFREMLRIKRSVQAQFNTEASYLAAQALGTIQESNEVEEPQDAMAAAEKTATKAGTNGPAFVAAKTTGNVQPEVEDESTKPAATEAGNVDEIRISDDED